MDMNLPVHPAQTRNDNNMNATWPNHELSTARQTAEHYYKCQPRRIPHNIRSPPIDPRHDTVAQTQYVSSTNKRDVATDTHELRQHTAQYEKAAMIVRCCPILGVDINGPTPDNEDPSYFYLVLQNLRSCCITTRELILALLDRHGDPVELSFTRTGRDSFSAFLAYKTIPQLLRVAQQVPLRITRREIQTLLANSKYFPDEQDMLDLVRHYCQLDRPEAFFTRNDVRLLDQ